MILAYIERGCHLAIVSPPPYPSPADPLTVTGRCLTGVGWWGRVKRQRLGLWGTSEHLTKGSVRATDERRVAGPRGQAGRRLGLDGQRITIEARVWMERLMESLILAQDQR
jgi:hypothetical protein